MMASPTAVSDSSDDETIDRFKPRIRISEKKWDPDILDRYYISRTDPPAKFVLPFSKISTKPIGIPPDLHEEHEIYDAKFNPSFELSGIMMENNLRFWARYPNLRPAIKPKLTKGYRLRGGWMYGKKFADREEPYKSAVMAHWIHEARPWVLVRIRYPIQGFSSKEWQPLSVALESDVAADVVHYVFRLGLIFRDKRWWKVAEKYETLRVSKFLDKLEEEEEQEMADDDTKIKMEDC